MPFMPFSGGSGSVHGSDYGGQMPIIPPLGYQHSCSINGGMMPQDSRGTMMMNMPMMTGGSQMGGFGMLLAIGGDTRPLLMFSIATSVNAFAGPNFNSNPTDDDLFNALWNYLSTQYLMTVTKKYLIYDLVYRFLRSLYRTAREAIIGKFPNAGLTSRNAF
ncbi:hypothetical protein AZE42_09031 [Rhizopogon vesiculosus]|uniref:Uncharacterized protein n=1 Tax=Rhizopogon vesiculosus TaxID=180088 RepID=A0A1J8Q500_9AGAM|nr:hypothetical protein AZE42_09031 [Rhizopogon vesiculosus]